MCSNKDHRATREVSIDIHILTDCVILRNHDHDQIYRILFEREIFAQQGNY